MFQRFGSIQGAQRTTLDATDPGEGVQVVHGINLPPRAGTHWNSEKSDIPRYPKWDLDGIYLDRL